MINKIKNKLTGTDEKKCLINNIFSLGILQAASYFLPLLTVPYLVRVLGPEYFGLLSFSTATIGYFVLISDYGFNLTATRQISIYRHHKAKVCQIFSSVMIIKTVLMLISFVLMSLLIFSFEKFSQHWEVYFITFGTVVGQVLFPVWLFQGMERMKYITYLNVGAKTFFTVCIFIFVRNESDYLLVPLFTSMGFIVAGVWSLYLVRWQFDIRFSWQNFLILKMQLIDGWHVFFSSIAISLYTISTTFILGLFTNNVIVGQFSAIDKIVQAVKGLYRPVSQAIYPLVGKKIHENRILGLAFVYKVTWVVGIGMFLISSFLLFFSEPLVTVFLGEKYIQATMLLKVMSFLPFIIALSNIFGVQIMLNVGYQKPFSRILIVAAIIGVGLSFVLVPAYQALGSAWAVLVVEMFVTVTMGCYLKRKLRDGYFI